MRLIDADALIEIVEDGLRNNPHKDGYARVCHRTEYTHFGDVIQRMPTIATPPNDPLTLEELREMDGEPVWVELIGIKRPSAWYLLNLRDKEAVNKRGGFVSLIYYGDTWLAYRRRLEEGIL